MNIVSNDKQRQVSLVMESVQKKCVAAEFEMDLCGGHHVLS